MTGIDNATIEFAQGKYGDFGNVDDRRKKLQKEEEIKIELKEKYKKGEITHDEYLKQYDEQIKGEFKSLNQIDDFHIDKDINLNSVYFVTREKQDPEYPDDKYQCYEIYDKDTGKIIADTDRDNNLNFYDDELLNKHPELQEQAKKMFVMAKMNEKTKTAEDYVVIKNDVDYGQENKMKLAKDIKDDREHTIENKVDKDRNITNGEEKEEDKEAETEEKLIEKANNNKEKDNNNNGKGKVVVAKLIEDPAVRDNIPDATAKTWMVMYEGGEMDMLNGRGEKLESITTVNSMERNIDRIDKKGEDSTMTVTTFVVKGRENGLVFPVTKEQSQLQLNLTDRANESSVAIPISMQGNPNTMKNNMQYIYAQRTINEMLSREEYVNMVTDDPNISDRIAEMCYKQNDISLNAIQENIDICNAKYQEKDNENNKENDIQEDEHDNSKKYEEREIETPEERAWRLREQQNNE